jgi:hypothetical protein
MVELVAVKTSDLTGAALDWAVGVVESAKLIEGGRLEWTVGELSVVYTPGMENNPRNLQNRGYGWCPSSEWRQGGELLEKYHISFHEYAEGKVSASVNEYPWKGARSRGDWKVGPTRLIAACRAIVASKVGHVVNVPRELLGEAVTVPVVQAFTIWTEGYRATGEAATATCHGTFEGATFSEAVEKHLRTLSPESQSYYHQHKDGTWTCWGCRLFDNETDARKNFG